jgi:phenylacetate-CoA ligase
MAFGDIKKNLYLLKFGLFKPQTIQFYDRLERQQFYSSDELENLHWNKTKAIVSHAFKNVPYYRKKYTDVGFSPEDLKKNEDFSYLPLLTKDEVRENFTHMISAGTKPSQIRPSTTGGSTGEPLKVYFDKSVPLDAFSWRIKKWWGIPLGANEAIIARKSFGTIKEWINNIAWLPSKRTRLDASSIQGSEIEYFVNRYNTIKPKLIWGYAGAIDYVAGYIQENKIHVLPASAVWVTSSPITKVQKLRIEKVFGAPVYDQYGCCEVFHLASECRARRGLHIFHDSRKIEFLKDDGTPVDKGEFGNIALTDFENFRFPIIRYLNNDRGRMLNKKCSCGINLPLMDAVYGRQSDLIKLPDETCLAGDYLTTIFDDYPQAVKGFQLVQYGDYSIELKYIPNPDNANLKFEIDKVLHNLSIKTRNQIKIKASAVEKITHPNGKLKYIISELQ